MKSQNSGNPGIQRDWNPRFNFWNPGIPNILDSQESTIAGIPWIPEIESGIPKTLLDSRSARILGFLVVFSSIFFFVSFIVFVADRHLHELFPSTEFWRPGGPVSEYGTLGVSRRRGIDPAAILLFASPMMSR